MKKKFLFFILLGFFLFIPKDTFAEVLSHQSTAFLTTVDNLTEDVTIPVYNNPFANRGAGYINFTLSLNKVSGSSTSPVILIRDVNVTTFGAYYACSVGTVTLQNSTFGGTTYSLTCPVEFNNSEGLTSIRLKLMPNQQNESSQYRLQFSGLITYMGANSFSSPPTDVNSIMGNNNYNTDRVIDTQNETKQSIDETNNILNNDDTSASQNQASNFFGNFSSNSHGLSGIISAPLRLIQSLSSDTCNPLSFPLPFVQQNVTLPCMSSIYSTYFGAFFTLYQLITTGLIGYWVVIKLFGHVKNLQDPNKDKIEVFEL